MLAIIGTLLGALIGAAAALAAQQIAARDASKRERIQRRAAMRAELLDQTFEFFRSAQEVERIAAGRDQFDNAAKDVVHRDLWTEHKKLTLICSEDLKEPLDELANLLTKALWDGPPNNRPVYEYIRESTWRFRQAAQREIQWIEE